MKTINLLMGMSLAFASLVSCESSFDETTDINVTKELSVTTNLTPITRTSIDFETDKSFYLYVDQSGTSYDYFAKMSYESNEWKSYDLSDSPLSMELVDDSGITVSALYCGDKVLTEAEFTAITTYSVDGVDMLYAKSGVDGTSVSSDGVISLEFSHLLSKLDIEVDVNLDTLGDISSVKIGSFQDSFAWTASTNNGFAANGSAEEFTESGNAGTYSYIITPQTLASGFDVTITFATGETYISHYTSGVTLASGSAYSLKITIGEGTATEITYAGSFTVKDWTIIGSWDDLDAVYDSKLAVWDGTTATAFTEGDGTIGAPYMISSGSELAYLASQVNGMLNNASGKAQYAGIYFELANDIDLNGGSYNWTPIGNVTTVSFSGNFNGAGYTISNMSVTEATSTYYGGLFGYVNGSSGSVATIEDLTLEDCTVASSTGTSIAALIGYIENYAELSSCSVVGGSVTTTASAATNVGGLVGLAFNDNITVTNCHVEGVVLHSNSGTIIDKMGGIVGKVTKACSILASSFDGTISYEDSSIGAIAGGIVGDFSATEGNGTITGCYATGTYNGKTIGGLVGINYGTITGSYSTASVTGTTNVGGIAGTSSSGTFSSVFYATSDENLALYKDAADNEDAKVSAITNTEASTMNSEIESDGWKFVSATSGSFPYVIEEIQY